MQKLNLWGLSIAFLALFSCTQHTAEKTKDVKNGQVNINYQVAGAGPVTLLFVHGAYIDLDYWKNQVQYFSPNYRVLTMDLAGHGQSGHNRTDWTVAQFGQDLVAVLDQLDLHNVILIGHSMGGDVALEAAVARPDRILGLIGIDFFKNAGQPLPPE